MIIEPGIKMTLHDAIPIMRDGGVFTTTMNDRNGMPWIGSVWQDTYATTYQFCAYVDGQSLSIRKIPLDQLDQNGVYEYRNHSQISISMKKKGQWRTDDY